MSWKRFFVLLGVSLIFGVVSGVISGLADGVHGFWLRAAIYGGAWGLLGLVLYYLCRLRRTTTKDHSKDPINHKP